MKFTKGCIPWNKGKNHTRKTKQKMRIAKLGKPSNRKGKKFTLEQLEKLSKSHLGQRAWNKGMKLPQFSGENHPRYIKDRTKLKRKNKQGERRTSAYNFWRKQVWERDSWKCKINNEDCKGKIEAHHILSWREHKKLHYEINNGITLCQAHHPRKRAEEKRLIPVFQGLVPVSN